MVINLFFRQESWERKKVYLTMLYSISIVFAIDRKFDASADINKPLKLPLNEFLTTVGQLKFRGTSVLFRSPRSFLTGYDVFLAVSFRMIS